MEHFCRNMPRCYYFSILLLRGVLLSFREGYKKNCNNLVPFFKNIPANRTTKGLYSEKAATLNPISRKFSSQSVTLILKSSVSISITYFSPKTSYILSVI